MFQLLLLGRFLVRSVGRLLQLTRSGTKLEPGSVRARLYSTKPPPPPLFNVFTGLLVFAAGAAFGAALLWFEPEAKVESGSTTKLEQLSLPHYATNAQIDKAITKIKEIVTPLNV